MRITLSSQATSFGASISWLLAGEAAFARRVHGPVVGFLIPNSGCWVCLLGCGRDRIQLAVARLDASGADMALYGDAYVVRAIVWARRVKFLSGLAGSQAQDALAETRCAGFASR